MVVSIMTQMEIKQISDGILSNDDKAFVYVQTIKEASGGILKEKAHVS